MTAAALVRPRATVLGFEVDAVGPESVLARLPDWLADGRPHQIVTANALMLLAAGRIPALAEALRGADLVVPDSAGVAWAAGRKGVPLAPLAGIELMDRLCGWAAKAGRRVFFLGAAPGVARAAAEQLAARHPGLRQAGARDGYFTEDEPVIREVAEAAPDFLFVALPTPRQDMWIHRHSRRLGAKILMGVGGSFDVVAGRLRRAPVWMRGAGLEWLFRLCQEPGRAWRMRGLPVFAAKVLMDRD